MINKTPFFLFQNYLNNVEVGNLFYKVLEKTGQMPKAM
jgi:hypothetical protein